MSSPERQQKEAQLKQVLSIKLEDSGEKDRIRELLRLKLIECGWREKLKADCKELISRQQDLNKVKVSRAEQIPLDSAVLIRLTEILIRSQIWFAN